MAEMREYHPWTQDWIQFLGYCLSPVLWRYHMEGGRNRGLFIKIEREEGFPPY